MKTYYLGKTKRGAYVARASASDYGYTFAATFSTDAGPGEVIPLSAANFSRSADGARKAAASYVKDREPELVPLQVVDRATYKAATGKA